MLLHAPTRKSMACFGAVSLLSGMFVWSLAQKFNALTFESFLKRLLRHRSGRRRMVLDNAAYRHARSIAPLLHKYRSVLTLLFLPPYSPQLSHIERVRKLARRLATHNRALRTMAQTKFSIAQTILHYLQ